MHRDKFIALSHLIKTSYKKFGYVKDISYIYILLNLGKDNFFKKQICLFKISFVYLVK